MEIPQKRIKTLNWHIIKACNMQCKFCYARFAEIKEPRVSEAEGRQILEALAASKLFRKINFAGGEPTLIPELPSYIRYAKELGFEVSMVTNGSFLTKKYLEKIAPFIDLIGLSMDSLCADANELSGRSFKNSKREAPDAEFYKERIGYIQDAGIALKINTVVTNLNMGEDFSEFINWAKPMRWKVLQVSRVEGQNEQDYPNFAIERLAFQQFTERHRERLAPDIQAIFEEEEIIKGSYVMMDQLGRFYSSLEGYHKYSEAVLEHGVFEAYKQLQFAVESYYSRDGDYSLVSLLGEKTA